MHKSRLVFCIAVCVTTSIAMASDQGSRQTSREAQTTDQSPGNHKIQLGGLRIDPITDPDFEITPTKQNRLQLIQFDGPIQKGWRRELEDLGFLVFAYVPNHTYLVWDSGGTEVEKKLDSAIPNLRWRGPLPHRAKCHNDLASTSGRKRLMVLHVRLPHAPELEDTVISLGGKLIRRHPAQPDGMLWNAIIELDAEQLLALSAAEQVVWIEEAPGKPVLSGEMSSAVVSGDLDNGIPHPGYDLWLDDFGYDGSGVRWAVVDSGVDPLHPDFANLSGLNYPGCETDLPGDDRGELGHGTPVAGIIAGTAAGEYADDEGFLWGLGVAPGAAIFSQNVYCLGDDIPWPPNGGWQILSRDGILAGAVGSNNSWTTQEGIAHGYQISERIHDLLVRDGNFDTTEMAEPYIMVFSIGNEGPDPFTVGAPGEAKNLITVGAISNYRVTGNLYTICSFSSRGPTLDGRVVPTLMAPGEGVGAARHRLGGFTGLMEIPDTDGLYINFQGTSAATPHISGILAIITQWWQENERGNAPSPAMARALVVNAAVPLEVGAAPPNFDTGWGRIQLDSILAPGVTLGLIDQQVLFTATGEFAKFSVQVVDPSQPLRITLAWTDDAAAAGADPTLVNDLDLSVENGGSLFLGNVTQDGWSISGGEADRLNNLEDVNILEPGNTATIKVTATHLPGNGVPYNASSTDQDYALVCRNCRFVTPAPRHTTGRRRP